MNRRYTVLCMFIAVMALAACGGKEAKTESEDYTTADAKPAAGPSSADLIAEGESLVKASDCKTCHHPVNKIIGPPHTDVAKKYEFTSANVKLLAEKIIKGGTGVWGQVPMTAHPDVSQDAAEKMARYVLSLDGEKEH